MLKRASPGTVVPALIGFLAAAAFVASVSAIRAAGTKQQLRISPPPAEPETGPALPARPLPEPVIWPPLSGPQALHFDARALSAGVPQSRWQVVPGAQLPGAAAEDQFLVAASEPALAPRAGETPLLSAHAAPDGFYDVWVRLLAQGEWPEGFLYGFPAAGAAEVTERFLALEGSGIGSGIGRYLWYWLGQTEVRDGTFRFALGPAMTASAEIPGRTVLHSIGLTPATHRIAVGPARLVAQAAAAVTESAQATHRNPKIAATGRGDLWVKFSQLPPGTLAARPDGYAVSRDRGATWQPAEAWALDLNFWPGEHGLFGRAADGSLVGFSPWAQRAAWSSTYEGTMFRSRDDGAHWAAEPARFTIPLSLQRDTQNPAQVQLGLEEPVLDAQTGRLYAVGAVLTEGQEKHTLLLMVSDDQGASWRMQSSIAPPGPLQPHRYLVPTLARLANGAWLLIVSIDGNQPGPGLIEFRSQDDGLTWSEHALLPGLQGFKTLRFSGAFQGPRLLRLANGVLALAYGRPGMSLSFSLDGEGRWWSHHVRLALPYRDPHTEPPLANDTSSGFGSLAAVGDEALLVAYDQANYTGAGAPANAILARPVTVTRLQGAPDGAL